MKDILLSENKISIFAEKEKKLLEQDGKKCEMMFLEQKENFMSVSPSVFDWALMSQSDRTSLYTDIDYRIHLFS